MLKLITLLLVLSMTLCSCAEFNIFIEQFTGADTSDDVIENEQTPPTNNNEQDPPTDDNQQDPPADDNQQDPPADDNVIGKNGFDYSEVPEFSGNNYVVINNNTPYFTSDEITDVSFENYSELDSLGRVGVAFASLSTDTMPTGTRNNPTYKPTGWVQNSYSTTVVPQTNIYNRSHLIAWSLSAEENNKLNLMTGTPYFNQIGMQIFENQVLDYIKETGNHVMYRVTPVFVGDNLLANGVLMEGLSVEDNGDGICFCVFMYNVQPGITIDYATGENYQTDAPTVPEDGAKTATLVTDVSQLTAGTKIVIVAKDYDYALGTTQNTNNRSTGTITKAENQVSLADDVEIITIGVGTTTNTFSLSVSGGYLYAASSSNNWLRTETALTANSSWTIEIASSGIATIIAAGSNTRNVLRYNTQSQLFSTYAAVNNQKDICIYIINE